VATFNWPGLGIKSVSWSLDQPAQVNSSQWTGKRTVMANPWHGKWTARVELSTKQGDAAFRAARAFFTQLKGQICTFHLPAVEEPQNSNTGVTVNTTAAQGATALALTGLTTALVAGNMITVNGQLLSITSVGSLVSTVQTVNFMPALRAQATATTAVQTAKPYALVALSDSSFTWDIGSWRRYGLTFNAEEAVGETDGASVDGDTWDAAFSGGGGGGSPSVLGVAVKDNGGPSSQVSTLDFVGAALVIAGSTATVSTGGATPQSYGAVVDGTTNDHSALQSWLDRGGELSIPVGEYYSSDNLILRKNAVIEGGGYGFDARTVDGSATLGYENQPGARIHFAAGKGFKVEPQTTVTDVATAVAAGVGGYTQEGAMHSTIRNLALIGAGTSTTVTGFYSRTEVHLENVFALKFTGKGFDISASADAPDGNSEFGAADLSTLKNCQAISNGSHGFHIRGREANVIGLDTCNAFSNGGWGFLDESIFGNNYVNCHAAANTSGSFKCINAVCDSTYTGCYTEQDSGKAPDLSIRCIVIGGLLADTARLYNVGTNGHPAIGGSNGFEANQYALRYASDEGTTVANGHAMAYRGANRGLCLIGAPDGGGSYDVCLVNKSGAVAAAVPTGSQNFRLFGNLLDSGANQLLTSRRTGWAAPTGTATRSTFATSTVTLAVLAEHVKALIDDLTTHGVIGT
jgi:hypothetical protein